MSENTLTLQVRKAIDTESLVEFIRENLQGENLSIKGVAALCGVADTSIIRGAAFKSAALAQKLEAKGFESAALAEEGFNPVATWLTIDYFANESKAKAVYAKAIANTFGAFGVKTAFNQISDDQFNQQIQPNEPKLIAGFVDAGKALGEMFGPAYGESFALLNIKKHCPNVALPEVPAKERASLKSSEALLTPTEIADQLGMTYKSSGKPNPRAANNMLAALGYQEKIEGKWSATEKGKPFSDRKPVSTNSKSDKDQLLWYASIIDELRGQEMESAA
ncbi:hypothetical protein N836_31600 [Leptolyngbya sp. Heron Island J]|uniref:hypothetical protein n=1 Tax=Leptolyngbya sp. Heron Island J TaxID=1385935 RepID=UPI0003B94DF0|nr:hypothetical protein [Leptolyngbya sp. Heron Island J]ESA38487.1 hypothetical protein N836_31600 [Leptolyngbya sp. Heron Island J]